MTAEKDVAPTPAEITAMAKKVLAYLSSPEGQMRLKQRDEEAEKLVETFRQMRKISWEKLHEPFTI